VGLTSLATSAVAAGTTVHGSATNAGECDYTVVPNLLPAHDPLQVRVTTSSDAAPQPHDTGPITLSNTAVEVRIGADYFQGGVDGGLIGDGFTMPATVAVTLAGSNTVEGTRTLTESMTTTLQVVDGQARPLVMSLHLPETVWHPDSRGVDVFFSEDSERVDLTFDIDGIGRMDFTGFCEPSSPRAFVALGSVSVRPPPPPTTTTTQAPPTTLTVPVTIGQIAAELPHTGSDSGYAVLFAVSCLGAGALLLASSRKRRPE
jgi:LPXTG-motif cell wall-anchored protein